MLKSLAKDYAEYSARVSISSDCDISRSRSEDLTPRGQKAARTKKYNKFADACETAGLSLREQTAILKDYLYGGEYAT